MIDWNRVAPGAGIARRPLLGGILAYFHATAPRERSRAEVVREAAPAVNQAPDLRSQHTVTTLSDGRKLMAGGFHRGPLSSVQIFDSRSNTWSAAAPLNIPRQMHAATLLPDGRVLITGGISCGMLTETEIFDPATGRWSMAPSMNLSRSGHCADLLANGMVLVSGGTFLGTLAGAELFDGCSWMLA